MRFPVLLSLIGLSVAMGSAPALAQRNTDISGKWKAQATGMGGNVSSCDVTLSNQQSFGQYTASSFGCTGELFGVSKWRIDGRRVIILNAFGKTLATLHMDGARMKGRDAKGQPVTFYRPGTGTQMGQAHHGGSFHWSWGNNNRNCVVYADNGRCADREDLRAPRQGDRIQTLADSTDIHAFPFADSHVMRSVDNGTCLRVVECRRMDDARWCAVRGRHDVRGYVVQTLRRHGGMTLRFRRGC